jgi:hypothetical protein
MFEYLSWVSRTSIYQTARRFHRKNRICSHLDGSEDALEILLGFANALTHYPCDADLVEV